MGKHHSPPDQTAIQRRGLLRLAGLVALSALPGLGLAQNFPNRPVRMIVPFPPGGGFDAIARPVADRMGAMLGQPIVVDNRAGAGGNIGIDAAARAEPDGYTFLFGNEVLATNPHIYRHIPYDPFKDLIPIVMVGTTPLILAASPQLPAKNLQELIALSAKRPLNFGSPGNGTAPHLFGELLNLRTPLKLSHVAYRGTGPAITDAMGGQIDLVLSTASSIAPQIKAGKLRGMAVLSKQRTALLPELPTLEEGGIAGLTHDVWYAMFAPAAIPAAPLARLKASALQALKDPKLVAQLREAGYDVTPQDGKDVTARMRADFERWQKVVAEAHIEKA